MPLGERGTRSNILNIFLLQSPKFDRVHIPVQCVLLNIGSAFELRHKNAARQFGSQLSCRPANQGSKHISPGCNQSLIYNSVV